MLPFKILTLALLFLIFLQDIKSRSVYWFLFPLLCITLLIIRFNQPISLSEMGKSVLINIGFLLMQLLILTIYFSLKNKRWINISDNLLGLGDIFFLISISFYLSVLNYLFFYVASLLGALVVWLSWQAVSSRKSNFIPLAGFQSMIFILFLASDWWLKCFDLTNDTWLLHLITK